MYIIIVGLGGIGRSLAAQSVGNGDNVVIIDRNEQRCSEMLEHYDVLAITGNATDKVILEDAGIDRADALVATTSDDSVNLMTCWLAKRFKVPNVVSIVNNVEHSDLFKEVGVKISENPDELVASRLYYWARNPMLQQLASIPGGTIFEIVAETGAPIVPLSDAAPRTNGNAGEPTGQRRPQHEMRRAARCRGGAGSHRACLFALGPRRRSGKRIGLRRRVGRSRGVAASRGRSARSRSVRAGRSRQSERHPPQRTTPPRRGAAARRRRDPAGRGVQSAVGAV